LLRLSAAQQTGLLEALVRAIMEVADPTIPGLSPPNPAVIARLVLTLLFLPVVGKLGGKILGCRELVVLHDSQGHPLRASTHRDDQH
jgi:hypothetical protein